MANISAIRLPNGTTYDIKDDISGYTTNTGTITKVKTTAGAHSTIDVSSGQANFNVPTKTSHLTNDSGFVTTDEKLKVEDVTNSLTLTTYYPVFGANDSSATKKKQDRNGLEYSISATTTGGDPTIAGYAILTLGNPIYTDEVGNKQGKLRLYGGAYYYHEFDPGLPSAHRTLSLPDKSGTVALTSDIVDEKMKWTASTSTNTYYPLQSTSTGTTSTANTLNSVSFYQYYNTAGGYRRLILGNTTAWKSSGGAYGTIRLYGAAATYYGDLVPGYLGTASGDGHLTDNRTWTLPDKTGTVALTSDIVTYTSEPAASGGTTLSLVTTGEKYTWNNKTSAQIVRW